jgi:F-type H+-transporting ATPase subunit b
MSRRLLLCLTILMIGAALVSPVLASAGEGSLNPLAPSAWKADLSIWTAVVFLCLLAVLWKFAWKPIAAGLEKGERGVPRQIAEAEAANQQAQRLLDDHNRQLAAASEQVRGILDQGRRDAERLGREMLDKAKQEAKAQQQRALQQIEAAADAAVDELAARSAALAVGLAGQIVRAKLNKADHARLIDDAVAGFVKERGSD